MPVKRPHSLATLLLGATALSVLHSAPLRADEDNSWVNNTMAACVQQYGEASCKDPEFVEDHFHIKTLQIAHKAAIRHKQDEQRALRELVLQRLCNQSLTSYCANDTTGTCLPQTEQLCTNLQFEAAQCQTRAVAFCEENPSDNCVPLMVSQCPSAIRQNINVLLLKYPHLTPQQQQHLSDVAQNIDSQSTGVIGTVFRWLGF